jgi:Ca2+-binding RTX toxin-like protein
MNDFTIKVNSGRLIDADTENKISQCAKYVANLLSRYIVWNGVLDIEVQVKQSSQSPYPSVNGILPTLAQIDWTGSSWTNSTLQECLTGIDTDPKRSDAGCTIYLSSDGTIKNYGMPVWFDPTPTFDVKPNVPKGSFDFIGVLTHEIFHSLGFCQVTNQWQSLLFQEGNQFYFNGYTVKNLLGTALPLTPGGGDHYGNTNLMENNVPRGLMFQWGNYESNRLDIGRIDLAVLQDLGYQIKTYEGLPLFELSDSDPNLTGTDANEFLFGNYQSNIINGLAGNDTLVGGFGNDTLNGGLGTDYVKYIDNSADCIISKTKDFCTVTTKTEGIDLIKNIEFFQFSDKIIDVALIAFANNSPTGILTIAGSIIQGSKLTASNTLKDADGIGTINFQWKANGVDISGATDIDLVLTQNQVGKAISVCVSYIDGNGNTESVTSASTASVTNANDAPTGSVTISSTANQNQMLTANNTLADLDGLGTIAYQWLSNNKDISNATQSTYKLAQSDVGNVISVKASYTDGFGSKETVTSAATAKIENVNDAPTGNVSISGIAAQGQTLTTVNTLADLDGLGTIKYQWLSNGTAISGATKSSYVLGASDIGKTISVKAIYTDLLGTIESVTSQITDAVISTKPSKGNDVLTGTAKNDTLSALAGNDILTGGLGADKLTGGLGADIFKYVSIGDSGITTKTRDTITDFKHSEGDKIDLSAIVLPSDQSFTYIGTIAFSNDATAQLRLDPKTGLLYGSTNADNIPEFSILLSGVKSLVPEDFIL